MPRAAWCGPGNRVGAVAMDISGQQLEELVGRVLECAPGLEETGASAGDVASEVMQQTLAVIGALEAEAATGFGAPLCVAFMVQGACSAIIDSMPSENLRMQLYRAGRVVGRFIADRFAEKIRGQMKPDA